MLEETILFFMVYLILNFGVKFIGLIIPLVPNLDLK